jgi:hypothetical protein
MGNPPETRHVSTTPGAGAAIAIHESKIGSNCVGLCVCGWNAVVARNIGRHRLRRRARWRKCRLVAPNGHCTLPR